MDDIFNIINGFDDSKDKQMPEQPSTPVNSYNSTAQPEQPRYTNQPYTPNNVYTPPVQGGYQYYQPPQQGNGNIPAQTYAVPPRKPKKKKNKSILVIIAIIIICVIVAIAGIATAVGGYTNKLDSFTGDKGSSVTQQKGDDASAKVEKSEGAVKKDKNGDYTAAGVAEAVLDSCVGITVYTEQSNYSYFYNYGAQDSSGDSAKSGEGSGVIMAESNGKTYIITCAHVIVDGSKFTVTLNDDTELEAKMVGCDNQTDIGVLVVEKTGLQVAHFGDSADIELGEPCVAIGCPGGLEFKNSVTQGIVSALARPIKSSIGYDNECIQVDAAINPGNSGGALFNMQGQVIGINSSKIASTEYEGMGFAVPSNTAIETANSLIKNGYVAGRAKLGVTYNSLSNYASASSILSELEQKGYKNAKGAMVIDSLSNDSDLNNKGIEQYDMIIAVNGKTLTSTDVMTSVLSDSKPGDTVTLTFARVTNDNSIKIFDVKCKLIESKE